MQKSIMVNSKIRLNDKKKKNEFVVFGKKSWKLTPTPAFSDLKFYIVPTHVTKITITTVFKVKKPNFVLLEINMYFREIAYPL